MMVLAGQLDFRSAIRSVAAEVAHIIPHDHLDVCVLPPETAGSSTRRNRFASKRPRERRRLA
ncbi:hypothetical protein CN105_01615 [Sinorhizobium meliloti]|nr:hypothetical protein CN105_01615 [Sinorhizobium meliloti]